MPYTLSWLNEDNDILVTVYSGKWTRDEVAEADQHVRNMLATTDKHIDGIVDMSATPWVPPRLVTQVTDLIVGPYANLHLLVYVSQSIFQDVMKTYHQDFKPLPFEVHFVRTFEDAFEAILRSRNPG